MNRAAVLCGAALAACAPASAPRGGIVSTNPCADAILLRLVAPARIAAISHYSQDPGATSLPLAVARRFRATAGTAEEVIALRPALVLADSFAPAATLAAYRRAGLRTVVLGSPVSVAASIAQVRQVAAAVGARDRGERLAGEIASALRAAPVREGGSPGAAGEGGAITGSPGAPPPHNAAHGPPPRAGGEAPAALFYLAGDLASGSGNLIDELLGRAGLRNAAADYGLRFTGPVPVETLVARPPAVVISTGAGRSAALRRQLLPGVRDATFPRTLVNCGGPSIPPALARLRAIRAGL